MAKDLICLWYDGTAQDAAKFYAETFPDSAVKAVRQAPSDYPGGKQGQVLTVEFTVLGVPCLGLNGGPAFRHSEAATAEDVQRALHMHWNADDVAAVDRQDARLRHFEESQLPPSTESPPDR